MRCQFKGKGQAYQSGDLKINRSSNSLNQRSRIVKNGSCLATESTIVSQSQASNTNIRAWHHTPFPYLWRMLDWPVISLVSHHCYELWLCRRNDTAGFEGWGETPLRLFLPVSFTEACLPRESMHRFFRVS